jgi:hypothetical protein
LRNGQVLQDPVLHVLQAIVVGFQDVPRLLHVQVLGFRRKPGQGADQVQPVAVTAYSDELGSVEANLSSSCSTCSLASPVSLKEATLSR